MATTIQNAVYNIYAGTIFSGTNISGTLSSNGISLSGAAQSAFLLSNSNGVSFGTNVSTVTASVRTNYAGTIFAGTNASGTIDTNGISISVITAPDAGINLIAGTQTATSGTVSFVNTNGVTFGMSGSNSISATVATNYVATNFATTTTNGSVILGTANTTGITLAVPPYLTTARASNDAAGLNTAVTNVTATINSSGISINASAYARTGFATTTTNGSVIVGTNATNGFTLAVPPYLTTARGSTDGIGLNTALTNVTATINSSGFSLNAAGYAGTGITTSTTGGTNLVGTLNTAGLSLRFPAAITTARGSTDAIGLNTAFTNVTATVNSSGLSINAAGYAGTVFAGTNATATLNSAGLSLSISPGGAGGGINAAAGTQTATSGTIVFANSNSITFGMSGSSQITASYAQSNQIVSVYGQSNTTVGSSGTINASSFMFAGQGIASVGVSNNSVIVNVPAGGGSTVYEVITASLSATQNDYSISGITTSANTITIFRVTPTTSFKFTGFSTTSWGNGKQVVIENVTDPLASGARIILLERESVSSTAANRISWPANALPLLIMPGDKVTLEYNTTSSRLELVDQFNANTMFDLYSECHTTASPFATSSSGTAAGATVSVQLSANTTQKTIGVIDCSSGTTSTGRCHIGTSGTGMMGGQGSALSLIRCVPVTLSDGTNTYTVEVGFNDGNAATGVVDGVYWEYDQATSADWRAVTVSNSTPTKNTVTGFTPSITVASYCGIFCNGNWTNIEYFYSTDGEVWTFFATAITTNIPTGTARVFGFCSGITKTVGSSARLFSTDYMGYRYMMKRGT